MNFARIDERDEGTEQATLSAEIDEGGAVYPLKR